MTRSLLLKPTMEVTSQPISCSSRTMGSAMAQPTPPPTTHAFLMPSTSVGLPRGPTKSAMHSPSERAFKVIVAPPTTWKMMVTAPVSLLQPATVRGMRSPRSSARRMMNCPARAFLATKGASISISVTVGLRLFFLRMRYMIPPFDPGLDAEWRMERALPLLLL